MKKSLPTLVLLPGLDGTGLFFARLEQALAGRLPVQTVSYPSDVGLGYHELPNYVRAKIGDAPAVLLGESFSGPVAIHLAATLPDQIKGLILAATFLNSPWPRWMIATAARAKPSHVPRAWIDAVLRGGSNDTELAAQIAAIMTGFDPSVRSARLKAVAQADATQDFARVSCPVLALHGRNDWLVWPGPMRRAIAAKPRAEMKLLSGPHMLLQTNAKDAAREIEAFVQNPLSPSFTGRGLG